MKMSAETARDLGAKKRMEQIYAVILNSVAMFKCQLELNEDEYNELVSQGYIVEEFKFSQEVQESPEFKLANKFKPEGYKQYIVKW